MNRFLEEIMQQPSALQNLITRLAEQPQLMRQWAKEAKEASRIVFSGMGSSHIAVRAVQPTLRAAGIPVLLEEAGEFAHYGFPPDFRHCLVVISQSG